MNAAAGFSAEALQSQAFAAILLLARIGPVLALMPGFGETAIPPVLKAGIALALTILMMPIIAMPAPATGIGLMSLVASEMVNGLWFGWLTRVLASSLAMAGQLTADFAGLSNILMPSPESGAQTTVVARLYEVAVPALILSSGLYREILSAFAEFYRLIPPGGGTWAADRAVITVQALTTSFSLALRLATPFLVTAVAWNLGSGLLARLVPRLQVFFVLQPGQIGLGLVLLAAVAIPSVAAWMQALSGDLAILTRRS